MVTTQGEHARDVSFRTAAMVVSMVLVLSAAVVNPTGDFPLIDDWIYAWSVEHLLATAQLKVLDISAHYPFAQTVWGTLFSLAFGFSHRPSDYWRVGFEYDRVKYGQIADEFRVVTEPESVASQLILDRVKIRDVNQWRMGLEWVTAIFTDKVLALRGGAWYDPQHQHYFKVDDPATGFPWPRSALNIRKGENARHFSGGIGFTTSRHFQVDAAVDFSGPVSTFALSSVWRF